jgi:uncharacterized protein YukE
MSYSDSIPIGVQHELSTAGATVNAKAQEIADELASLAAYLQTVPWAGTAAQQYHDLQDEWNSAANGLFGPDGVLGQIAQALDITWGNYSEAEWANTTTWSQAAQ